MKYQTNELTGAILDAAVAKAKGLPYRIERVGHAMDRNQIEVCWIEGLEAKFCPSSSWLVGGPIIERERIAIVCSRPRFDTNDGQRWDAYFDGRYTGPDGQVDCKGDISEGATPLIAAMRSFVTAKLGEETDL